MFTNTEMASEKWKILKQTELTEAYSRFRVFQKQMNNEKYEKLSTIFKDDRLEKTSNGAERLAPKIKGIQKSHYRLRTKKSLRDFIMIERILKESQLTNEEMEELNPFKKRHE